MQLSVNPSIYAGVVAMTHKCISLMHVLSVDAAHALHKALMDYLAFDADTSAFAELSAVKASVREQLETRVFSAVERNVRRLAKNNLERSAS